MQAHGVEAVAGETGGDGVGLLVGWEIAGEGDVDAPESDALLAGEEVAVARYDGTVLAGGFVEKRFSGQRARHIFRERHRPWRHVRRRRGQLGESASGEEQNRR